MHETAHTETMVLLEVDTPILLREVRGRLYRAPHRFTRRATSAMIEPQGPSSAIVTEAVRYIEIESISQLAEIYALQDLVDAAFRRLLDVMTSLGAESGGPPAGSLRRLRAALAQLIELEEQLAERYDGYLGAAAGTVPSK